MTSAPDGRCSYRAGAVLHAAATDDQCDRANCLGPERCHAVRASLEILTGIVRVHPVGSFGDAYTYACTIKAHGTEAEIVAVLRAPTRAEYRAIVAVLRSHGYALMWWDRHKAGSIHRVRHRLDGQIA